jgi:hypothetical protein
VVNLKAVVEHQWRELEQLYVALKEQIEELEKVAIRIRDDVEGFNKVRNCGDIWSLSQ